MKIRLVVMCLCLWIGPMVVWGGGAEDQYVTIYNLIQQADALNQSGQTPTAMSRYAEAQTALKRFQSAYPNWNPNVVSFRLNYLAGKIDEITAKTQAASAALAKAVAATKAPVAPEKAAPAQPAPPMPLAANVPPATDTDHIIRDLQQQLRMMEADRVSLATQNSLLEAKLREAMAARPTASDPRELAKAQEQARELAKHNELLRTSLEQARTNGGLVQLRQSLAASEQRATQLAATNAALLKQNQALQAGTKGLVAVDAATLALRQENEILKKQVRDLSATPAAAGVDANRKLLETQTKLAALQSDYEVLRLENMALSNHVKRTSGAVGATAVAATAAVVNAESREKIRQLEILKDDLQKKLDAAQRENAANGRNRQLQTTRADELTREKESLQARIDVLEARRLPYTDDELALMNEPQTNSLVATAAVRSGARRAPGELPANGAALLAEARQFYASRQLEKAEAKYQEIVKLDSENVSALTDLASIQVDLKHLQDAERNVKSALAIEPKNDYSLFVLGRLRFQQGKYDDALDALSRAAEINPKDAEIQNYLGITLSEKGLRGPAEAALRKAIQLKPDYASAHANLAFIYITQKPPLTGLAKWHYDKAIASGQPHNPELEKLLEAPKTSGGGQ